MKKLNEVLKINEGLLMGNEGKKLVADWLEYSERLRNLFVGSKQSRTPDAFGQGAVSQDKRGEHDKILELLDELIDEIEKNTGVQSAVPKDIPYY